MTTNLEKLSKFPGCFCFASTESILAVYLYKLDYIPMHHFKLSVELFPSQQNFFLCGCHNPGCSHQCFLWRMISCPATHPSRRNAPLVLYTSTLVCPTTSAVGPSIQNQCVSDRTHEVVSSPLRSTVLQSNSLYCRLHMSLTPSQSTSQQSIILSYVVEEHRYSDLHTR